MKQIIDVPAGHTVTIKQEGSQLIVETKSVMGAHKAPLSTAVDFGKVRTGDVLMVGEAFMLVACVVRQGSELVCISYNPKQPGLGMPYAKTECGTTFHKLARKATEVEKRQLFDALRDKHALMWDGKELVNWRADLGGSYWAVSSGGSRKIEDRRDSGDKGLYSIGNYFPEGFLTDARIAEFKGLSSKLFASWRR